MLNATTLNCEAYYYWPSEDAHSSTCGQVLICYIPWDVIYFEWYPGTKCLIDVSTAPAGTRIEL